MLGARWHMDLTLAHHCCLIPKNHTSARSCASVNATGSVYGWEASEGSCCFCCTPVGWRAYTEAGGISGGWREPQSIFHCWWQVKKWLSTLLASNCKDCNNICFENWEDGKKCVRNSGSFCWISFGSMAKRSELALAGNVCWRSCVL